MVKRAQRVLLSALVSILTTEGWVIGYVALLLFWALPVDEAYPWWKRAVGVVIVAPALGLAWNQIRRMSARRVVKGLNL